MTDYQKAPLTNSLMKQFRPPKRPKTARTFDWNQEKTRGKFHGSFLFFGGPTMELEKAIELVKRAVKHTGTIDQKHIDFTLIAAEERELYDKALRICQLSIMDGKMTRDEFIKKVNLDS
jgi:hypothetical protein